MIYDVLKNIGNNAKYFYLFIRFELRKDRELLCFKHNERARRVAELRYILYNGMKYMFLI